MTSNLMTVVFCHTHDDVSNCPLHRTPPGDGHDEATMTLAVSTGSTHPGAKPRLFRRGKPMGDSTTSEPLSLHPYTTLQKS